MQSEPWLIVPQLKKECIKELAYLLISVRRAVIDRHEPEIGDTKLSLGLRAYECCRSQLISKSLSGDWPWLSILTETGRFTLAVNSVPVRFTRNEPDKLPDRKLIMSAEANKQMELFQDESDYAKLRWFLVIDSAYDTAVENAYFVGYAPDNSIECMWHIPLTDRVPLLADLTSNEPQAVDIPAAKAKLKIVKKKEDTNKYDE